MIGPPIAELVVEVLHDRGGPGWSAWSVGSGIVLGGRRVLTAAHNVGAGEIIIRVRGREEYPATVRLIGQEDDFDLAVLDVPTLIVSGVLRCGTVARERAGLIMGCWAIGFPRFKERLGAAKPVRLSVQVDGEIPTGENLEQDLLTFRVTANPRPLAAAVVGSEWEGMSGAAVFAGDVLVGVITEHHRPEGSNALTVVPIAAINAQSNAAQWWAELGIDPLQLTPLSTVGHSHADTPGLTPMAVWNIQLPVHKFVGRQDELDAIHESLTSQDRSSAHPVSALYGLAGIGKSQLARCYAARYRDEYQLGWWIHAETEWGVTTGLAELAVQLGYPAGLPKPELAQRARLHLGQQPGWLLVFDNVHNQGHLEQALPPSGRGHVLVTSRNPTWRGLADPIEIDLLPLPDAIQLLIDRTGQPDEATAGPLAEELGRLPLALEQAAAYIENTAFSMARYLQVFGHRKTELLAEGTPVAYGATVHVTFTLAVERVASQSPAAVQLLEICALLSADRIPIDLLLSRPELLPEPLDSAAADVLGSAKVVGLLHEASLLTPDTDQTMRMHRLVQTITIAQLSPDAYLQLLGHTVPLLAMLFPDAAAEPTAWPVADRLFPHIRAVLDHVEQAGVAHPIAAELLSALGIYVTARGHGAAQARHLDERSLLMRQHLYPDDHPDVAHSLNNLAVDLRDLGKPAAARKLDQQALAIRQRLYEHDHPHVAASLTHLASDLAALGDFAEASNLHARALTMYRRLFRNDHPDIADCLSGLSIALRELGEHESAQELDEQVLAMNERLYQGDHPAIATSISNLAGGFKQQGKLDRALELFERALAMRQCLYPDDHPDIAASIHNLAATHHARDEPNMARDLDEQALSMRRRLFGGDHPDIALSLHNLALDFTTLREFKHAHELNEQALVMRQRLYEGDHPAIAQSLTSLAMGMTRREQFTAARDLHQQALAMRQRLYRDDHAEIAQSLTSLAGNLLKLKKFDTARTLLEQALAMRQRLYPEDHPAITDSYRNLAVAWQYGDESTTTVKIHEEGEQVSAMRQRLNESDSHIIADASEPPPIVTGAAPTDLDAQRPDAQTHRSSPYLGDQQQESDGSRIQAIHMASGDTADAQRREFLADTILPVGAGPMLPDGESTILPLFVIVLHDEPQTWARCPQLQALFARLDRIGSERLTQQLITAASWAAYVSDTDGLPMVKLKIDLLVPIVGKTAFVFADEKFADLWQHIADGGLIGITTTDRLRHRGDVTTYGDVVDICVLIPIGPSELLRLLIRQRQWSRDHGAL